MNCVPNRWRFVAALAAAGSLAADGPLLLFFAKTTSYHAALERRFLLSYG